MLQYKIDVGKIPFSIITITLLLVDLMIYKITLQSEEKQKQKYPSTQESEAGEGKASLVFIVSSGPARATEFGSVSKQ